jgi:hypothetical protein
MDLWNASSAAGATKMRPNPSCATSGVVPAGLPEQWIQVWALRLLLVSFLSFFFNPVVKFSFWKSNFAVWSNQ